MAFSAALAGDAARPEPEPALAAPRDEATLRVAVTPLPRQEPVRVYDLSEGVHVEVFVEGDGETFPSDYVEANVVGRLLNGCTFESTRAKAQPPMRMDLGKRAILLGMELGLRSLSLGARAELRIPAQLGYASTGVPRMIPPDSDLLFEVDLVVVDGKRRPLRASEAAETGELTAATEISGASANGQPALAMPWWLARVERPLPSSYYLSVCRHLARCLPLETLARARPVPRKTRAEAAGWDLTGGALVITGVQDEWRAREDWDLAWFRERLGDQRQLVKWQGPVFTKQESLWQCPIWETSVAEYIDYVMAVDAADPGCAECNAADCPRLYLNGWPAFNQMPWLREYVANPTFVDDMSADLIMECDELKEAILSGVTKSYQPPPEDSRKKGIEDEYWDMTKLFISPKGALTRLHYDNGGAHAWLSQVRGRKLFVCYAPEDGPHLHPFEGDEGLMNGTWLDPLDADVLEKWPDYAKATPYVTIVEEGETIFAPQGWWHYAVALDSSVTVMRNFFSKANGHEYSRRKDDHLAAAFAQNILKRQSKLAAQSDAMLLQIAQKTVKKIRETLLEHADSPAIKEARESRRPASGGCAGEYGF